MRANGRTTAIVSRLIGYARVSTEEQGTDPQLDELRAAGCDAVCEEHASGADRTRPVLARLLRKIRPGETLVVVRLDRLARSVSHLLAVIEQLEANGCAFPQPARPDRHHNATGHVLAAAAGRRRPARTSSDRRAHQGRAPGCAQPRSCRRQPWPVRSALAATLRT
jgi:hypothetical protein